MDRLIETAIHDAREAYLHAPNGYTHAAMEAVLGVQHEWDRAPDWIEAYDEYNGRPEDMMEQLYLVIKAEAAA